MIRKAMETSANSRSGGPGRATAPSIVFFFLAGLSALAAFLAARSCRLASLRRINAHIITDAFVGGTLHRRRLPGYDDCPRAGLTKRF